jgi:hypothetical protein
MQARRRRDLNAFQLRASLHDLFADCGLGDWVPTLRNFARFAKRQEIP